MSLSRLSTWLLLGVALFVVVGHICAEPFHVHAGTVTTHGESEPDHSTGEVARHGGLCEAVRADVLYFQFPALVPSQVEIAIPGLRFGASLPTDFAPAATGSPPRLFLLHSALLI